MGPHLTRPCARSPIVAAATLLLASCALVACAPTTPLLTSWNAPAITVDGDYTDWGGRFTDVGGKRSVGLAVANDRENLYLCVATRDLSVQTLLRRGGFTVWLDPQGGEREVLGVRVAPVEGDGEEAVTPRVEIVFDGAEYGYQLAELGPEQVIDVKTAARADVVVYEFRLALGKPLVGGARESTRSTLGAVPAYGVGVISAELPPLPDAPPDRRRREIDPLRVWARVPLSSAAR